MDPSMSKPNPLRTERPFKLTVNHRRLEPMLVDADRRQRKLADRVARPLQGPWDPSRQDD
jgi:hypothetical protein